MITKINRINRRMAGAALFTIICSLFTSCSDDNEPARTPVAQITVNKTQLRLNESMEIDFTGVADQVVVFTGDPGHDYALRDSSNTGYVVNKGMFTYSYATPGTFHVVCVASTYDSFMGSGLRQAVTELDVTVEDDVTTIGQLYTTITPNVFYAERLDDDKWVLRLPEKQVYNGREIAVNAKRQRLTIAVASDYSTVSVDGEPYVAKNYYDLTSQHTISVQSHAGSVRDYQLLPLIYPVLKGLKADGSSVSPAYDAFYQDVQTYTLPAGSQKVQLTFDEQENVEFYANGEDIVSGATIDLTDTQKEYTLVRTSPHDAAVKAVTRVRFVVK